MVLIESDSRSEVTRRIGQLVGRQRKLEVSTRAMLRLSNPNPGTTGSKWGKPSFMEKPEEVLSQDEAGP